MQTRRIVASYEGLNSSLAQSPGKLWSCKGLPNVGNLYLGKGKSTNGNLWSYKVAWNVDLTWAFKVRMFHTPAPNVLKSNDC